MAGKDKVLEFINKEGAVLPIQIAKELNVDTMFSGALLSELVNEGKIKVTEHLKVGGTPVYFVNPEKLEDYSKYLNEQDIKTIAFLKEKGVVADNECSPLQRVSYRIVKDFAKSIVLKKDDGNKIIFWRYFLVDENAAKEKILEMVNGQDKKDLQKTLQEQPLLKKDVGEKKELHQEEGNKSLSTQKEKVSPKKEKKRIGNNMIKEFFSNNNISVWEEKVIRKDREINYIVSFDSIVGKLKYFVKFRDKKRITEGDISLAYNEAGKLPLLFLSRGELVKNARRLIEEDYKGIVFKKI